MNIELDITLDGIKKYKLTAEINEPIVGPYVLGESIVYEINNVLASYHNTRNTQDEFTSDNL